MEWLVGISLIPRTHDILHLREEKIYHDYSKLEGTSLYISHIVKPEDVNERAEVIFCMQVLLHAFATISQVAPEVKISGRQFCLLKEIMFPILVMRDGRKTTLQRLELWTSCRDKLCGYAQD